MGHGIELPRPRLRLRRGFGDDFTAQLGEVVVPAIEHGDAEAVVGEYFALHGNAPSQPHCPSPNCFDFFVVYGDADGLGELFEVHAGFDDIGVGADLVDRADLPVVFILDVAEYLLEDVFERHEAIRAAVFVRDDGHVLFCAFHGLQQVIDFH